MSYKNIPLILTTIDNDTQSIREQLFDLKGNLVKKVKIEITPYYLDHPGWAEQD